MQNKKKNTIDAEEYAKKVLSYIIGFSTYFVLLLGMLFGDVSIVAPFILYFPGALFPGLVLLFTPNVTLNRVLSFAVLCYLLYYQTIAFMLEHRNDIVSSWYYLIFGTLNAVLVSLLYSLLFKERVQLKRDLLWPFAIGVLSSLITFACSFLTPGLNPFWSKAYAFAYYSIFPLWTIILSRHLLANEKPARKY